MDAVSFGPFGQTGAAAGQTRTTLDAASTSSRTARLYVGTVIAAGLAAVVLLFPSTTPDPTLFFLFLAVSSTAAACKITLPIGRGDSTMSVSYAADFTALLLLGPSQTMLISMVSGWAQCAFNARHRNPPSRTLFSMATLVLTVQASGFAYHLLGGQFGALRMTALAGPLVGAALVYFLLNTGLVATAIGLSESQPVLQLWRANFLWAGPSYFVGAGTAAVLAILVSSSGEWFALLAVAPVYLTYRTYQTYLGRIEDEQRHVQQISELHWATMEALELARQSERALAAEKERLAITLRSIGDGVMTTDVHGRLVSLNHTAEQLTGWSQAEAAGRALTEIFQSASDGDETSGAHAASVAREEPARVRVTLQSRDGSARVVERVTTPLHDSNGLAIGSVLVFRDVTDSLALDQERLRASKIESLGVLAGGIAHDFNNILLAITGHLSLAGLEAQDDRMVRRLAEAERACMRARGLTQQLLTFARGGAPVRRRIGLGPLLHDWAHFALHGSNVRCESRVVPDLWSVNVDEGQMSQVINNIVLNAKQAMPAGGTLTIRASNLVVGPHNRPAGFNAADGRYVAIAITDSGPGIPQQHRRRIFDPYFTTKPDGTGLGLASSYSIVSKHEGHIGLDSEVGRGSTFSVYLPAEAPALEAAIARTGQGDPPRLRTRAHHGRRGTGPPRGSRDAGVSGVRSRDRGGRPGSGGPLPRRSRRRVRLRRRHAGFTVPGGMGGQEALAGLRAIDPAVRAIASSGYADDTTMARFREVGFLAVIPKPFAVPELGRVLDEVTATSPAPAPAHAGGRAAAVPAPAPPAPADRPAAAPAASAAPSLSIVERDHIVRVLQQLHGNKVAAARVLGVSRRTLYRRLRKHEVGTATAVPGVSKGERPTNAPRRP